MRTFLNPIRAQQAEDVFMEIFGCELSSLISAPDTFVKKALVYVLFRFMEYDKRSIGVRYFMTIPYVPTVCDEMEGVYLQDESFRDKIMAVLRGLNYKFEDRYSA